MSACLLFYHYEKSNCSCCGWAFSEEPLKAGMTNLDVVDQVDVTLKYLGNTAGNQKNDMSKDEFSKVRKIWRKTITVAKQVDISSQTKNEIIMLKFISTIQLKQVRL